MIKKPIIIVSIIGIVIILIFGINWAKRFFQIDSCLDRGGRWNYELNECEEYYDLDSEILTKLFWYTEYDSINNTEYLVKGELVDSLSKTPNELIEILNKRKSKSKIEFIQINGDTIEIRVLNDEFLTEQMGTTGAYCFLGETVFTLTENESFDHVRIEMNYGSHASPGIYNRSNFNDLMK